MQEILINNAVHETRVAVLEDGVLEELRIERNADVSLIGNIYLGVVGKVLPGMQSAFVEIGLPRAAFLHVSDMRQAHQENGGTLPIERLLTTDKWFSSKLPKIRLEQKALDLQQKSA